MKHLTDSIWKQPPTASPEELAEVHWLQAEILGGQPPIQPTPLTPTMEVVLPIPDTPQTPNKAQQRWQQKVANRAERKHQQSHQEIQEDELFQQVQQQWQQIITPEEQPANLPDNIPVISQEEEEEEKETFEAPQVSPYNLRAMMRHLMNSIMLDEDLVPHNTNPCSKLWRGWELANQVLQDLEEYQGISFTPNNLFAGAIIDEETGKPKDYRQLIKKWEAHTSMVTLICQWVGAVFASN